MAPAAGPTIGGFLIGSFGLDLPGQPPLRNLGILGALRIDERLAPPADPRARFDPLGLALLAAGVTLTLYGASQGPARGWWGSSVWPFLTWGVLLLFGYAVWGLRYRQPALDLGLLREFQPALALTLSVITSAVMFAALFLVPVLMQSVQRLSALTAGLALLPQGVVIGVCRGKPDGATRLVAPERSRRHGSLDGDNGGTPHPHPGDPGLGHGGHPGRPRLRDGPGSHARLPRAGLSSSAPDFSSLPPAIQHQLGAAAVAGFHDTFMLLTAVSVVGIGLAFLVRDPKPEVAMEREAVAQAAP